MSTRAQLLSAFDQLLQPQLFRDYGPNGLQVQGRTNVQTLVSGVTASKALIEAAIDRKADAILVHHGMFWRGHDGCITGWLKERLQLLLAHDINLFAYHLPLDAHETLGNNAQLAHQLEIRPLGRFGDQSLGWWGECEPLTPSQLEDRVAKRLGRRPLLLTPGNWGPDRMVRKLAWCTGGAQSYFEGAIAQEVDLFITGEISEPQAHYVQECGVAFMACGHHATERYGAPAVAEAVARSLGITHHYIEIDNPA
jgi:dinuclear metal center YbgI/SA1388 family protein